MVPCVAGAVRLVLAVQAVQATITGTVRDGEDGRALTGVIVSLPDLDRITVSDDSGRYVLPNVPAGPQHVVVRLIGYEQRTLHALVPPAGYLEINVALRPEPILLGTIEVRPPIAIRGVEHAAATGAFPERGLSLAAIRNHPQLAEPDVFQAMAGGEVVVKPETPTGLHIRGGASDQTAWVLDGIPVFSPYHAAGLFSAWNPDALARIDLASVSPSPALPAALSGVLSGTTRTPGHRYSTHSSLSTTHARITVDGPLGAAGFLLSLRSAIPAGFGRAQEGSYLASETGDLFAKLEAPLFGGRLRVLRYESENEIDAAAQATPIETVAAPVTPIVDARRNDFAWRSESTGATWSRAFQPMTLVITGWSARSQAGAIWSGPADARIGLAAGRRDAGLLATVAHTAGQQSTIAGVRLERSRTTYRVGPVADPDEADGVDARTPLAALFVEHVRGVGRRTGIEMSAALTHAAGRTHFSPRAQLIWSPAEAVTLSGGVARLHQFAQSVRNAESVVGTIFPADLHVGAGADGMPVARSDQAVARIEVGPAGGLRLGAQIWARDFAGLLLVAPRDGEPFVSGSELIDGFAVGSGGAHGLAVEAAVSRARYGLLASWGWQRVRYTYGDSAYVPDHGARHTVEAGAILFPTATSSVRAGVTGVLGRRGTAIPGAFEFESCNLIDAGCEFGGSPHYGTTAPGGARLPAYVRLDVGVRKHWDLQIAGRDALVAVFGTLTNVFARQNVLTWAIDAETGARTAIDLRPISPLVIGIDWRF